MKCFNHEDREVVATCQRCGKGLCKECASKFSPCLCEECHEILAVERNVQERKQEDERRQKYLDALVDTRGEFIKTCIWGVVWLIILSALLGSAGQFQLWFISFFFIPFGWKLLTYLQSFFPVTIFGSLLFWIGWIIIKGAISIFIGIPAFIYQLIKTVLVQKKIDQTTKNR